MRLDRSPFLICKMSVYSFCLNRNLLESFEINRISLQWMSNSIQQIMFVVLHFFFSLNKLWYLMSEVSVSVDNVYLFRQNVIK